VNRRGGRRSAFDHVGAHVIGQTLVVAVLLWAWWRASSQPLARDHEPWLNLGIGAVLVSGAVNGLFLMGARRAVTLRRALLFRTASLANPISPGPVAAGGPQRAPKFAAGPAMTRYHRPTCALAAGKPVELERRSDHEAAGRRPCGICRP
jgi:hypothetical protein